MPAKSLKFGSLPFGCRKVNLNGSGAGPCGPVSFLRFYNLTMQPAPLKPTIPLSVLEQIDIRVGTITSMADVPGADKLMQLTVDFGDHQRTIVAGIKLERADPSEILGKQALFVVNLEPRKMKGVLSEGMLFDIGYADKVTPVLALPEKPVPNGSRAG